MTWSKSIILCLFLSMSFSLNHLIQRTNSFSDFFLYCPWLLLYTHLAFLYFCSLSMYMDTLMRKIFHTRSIWMWKKNSYDQCCQHKERHPPLSFFSYRWTDELVWTACDDSYRFPMESPTRNSTDVSHVKRYGEVVCMAHCRGRHPLQASADPLLSVWIKSTVCFWSLQSIGSRVSERLLFVLIFDAAYRTGGRGWRRCCVIRYICEGVLRPSRCCEGKWKEGLVSQGEERRGIHQIRRSTNDEIISQTFSFFNDRCGIFVLYAFCIIGKFVVKEKRAFIVGVR